ncbi:unnamed protein product [Discosporangium mesarthrocarpum]
MGSGCLTDDALCVGEDETISLHWYSLPLASVWFIVLIYLLCHTADNYFSPVLAAICDLLKMSPEVGGVTFLAFGNGAADVFSSTVAILQSSGSNRRATDSLLVGVGALLGAGVFTVTVVVGCVVCAGPTSVLPLSFSRDIAFFIIAVVMVLWCSAAGEITVWTASSFLAVYIIYVLSVLSSSPSTRLSASDQNPRPPGEEGMGDPNTPLAAFWHQDQTNILGLGQEGLGLEGAGGGGTRGGGGRAGEGAADGVAMGVVGARAGENGQGYGPIGSYVGAGHPVHDDHFTGGWGDGRDRGKGGKGGGEGGRREGEEVGGVLSRVPGQVMVLFEAEDDSAASWLASCQSRHRGLFVDGDNGITLPLLGQREERETGEGYRGLPQGQGQRDDTKNSSMGTPGDGKGLRAPG